MIKKSVLSLSLLLAGSSVHAGFRDESWGAKPLSLGQAYTAVSGDVYAPFWNPAGLAGVQSGAFSLTGVRPLVDVNESKSYLGAFSFVDVSSNPIGRFGFSYYRNSFPAGPSQDVFALSLGRALHRFADGGVLSLGVNLKQMHASMPSGIRRDRSEFGADAGLMYVANPAFSIAATVRDINRPRLNFSTDELLPVTFSAGFSLWVASNTRLALEEVIPQIEKRPEVRGGVEQWFFNRGLALRAGGNFDYATAGFGLSTAKLWSKTLILDYAFAYPLDLSDNDRLHSLSLAVKFGGPKDGKTLWESAFGRSAQASPAVEASTETVKPVEEERQPEPAKRKDPFKSGLPAFGKGVTVMRDNNSLLLGPEDVVQISVKNHPELDVTAPIDPWGKVKLAFIGQLDVKGLSPSQLEKNLEKIYADFFVEKPKVEVTVKEYNSRVVYVLGAVKTPGKYSMKGSPLTVRDVILAAGLPTERAATWRIFVIRQGADGPRYRHINLYKILYRGQMDNNIELETGDTVYVPMGILDNIVAFVGRIFSPIIGLTSNVVGGGIL